MRGCGGRAGPPVCVPERGPEAAQATTAPCSPTCLQGGKVTLEPRPDLLARAEPRICAFDIECTKLPLQFPNAEYDQASQRASEEGRGGAWPRPLALKLGVGDHG